MLLGVLCMSASGAVYTSGIHSFDSTTGSIPDGSSAGWSDSHTFSGITDPFISDVTLRLNVSGGYNGDLYAYLSYNGVLVPLLNRVGVGSGNSFGYSDTGFDITLSTSGAFDVHNYGAHSPTFNGNGQLTGTWLADGRSIDPLSSPGSFDAAGTTGLGAFNSMSPNGTWTLFFADMSSGGQSQVVSWELDITAVPEPTNVALGIIGLGFLGISFGRSGPMRRFFSKIRGH
jgi:hypothetical protein